MLIAIVSDVNEGSRPFLDDALRPIFELQTVDREIARLKDELQDSGEIRELAVKERRLGKAQEQSEARAETLRSEQKTLRSRERELKACEAELAQIEAKIYGGEVKNPKELGSLNARLDSERKKKDRLEEEVLLALEAIEEAERGVKESAKVVKAVRARVHAADEKRSAAESERRARLQELQERRISLTQEASDDLVRQYEALAEKFNGSPLAQVSGGSCSGCHVSLPTSARASNTSHCPNCGRLLWWVAAVDR